MDIVRAGAVRCALVALVFLLAACSPALGPVSRPSMTATAVPSRAHDGPSTAHRLQERYDERISTCGPRAPAFVCSGIVLRATATSDGTFHTWDPSPKDIARGVISASWLRGDAPFTSIWSYSHGILFYPDDELPPGTDKIIVLCTFPTDGATNLRPGGCGPHPHNPVKSAPCQTQGIFTADQWLALWQTQRWNFQCGFDVNIGTPDSAQIFAQIPIIMAMLSPTPPYNEIVLQAWSAGEPSRRPIEAFFYLDGNATGLAAAQYDQRDYYRATHVTVPIIRLHLPGNGSPVAFDFVPEEQTEP